MKNNIPSRKKIPFRISRPLQHYLKSYNRKVDLPLQYEDLLRYQVSMPLYDLEDKDTLWETVYFDEQDREDIFNSLTLIYAQLKTDGDVGVLEHLTVARIDYCQFGNTKPFRVRIINRINDNYDHFYVKRADASRIYGLELEELLSPNGVNFLVDGETLIEEHVAGIPGDDFMRHHLDVTDFDKTRIAKEFVKFNERCFARLLGDMRSYNYVIDITPDIEGNQYRIRAIDFDQQSYEGRKNFYLPQYFKENNPVIMMGIDLMSPNSVRQYQIEERSLIAMRIKASFNRTKELFEVMVKDEISFSRKVAQLSEELAAHHQNKIFLKCNTMGEVVREHIRLLLRKDFKESITGR